MGAVSSEDAYQSPAHQCPCSIKTAALHKYTDELEILREYLLTAP